MARPSTTPNVRSISGLRNVRHRGGRWTRAERLSDANEPPFQIDRTKIVVAGSWKAPPGDGAFWSFRDRILESSHLVGAAKLLDRA